jgi:hypothetical protein
MGLLHARVRINGYHYVHQSRDLPIVPVAKQADSRQEARLQGLSELYNVLPDPQLQYNVLLELLR